MKKKLLIIGIALFSAVGYVNAQEPEDYNTKTKVLVIGGNSETLPVEDVLIHYKETQERGFQSSAMPSFVITGKDKKFSFTIGGFVNFRAAYDFDRVIDNVDFETYNIPTFNTPDNEQRLLMDASTTRLYFKTISHSSALGRIVTYVESDFRGADHNLRLRKAYVSFKGLLFGKNVTTFCDLMAGPNTIDFQGPNAYSYNYALMARYTLPMGEHWSAAIAVEMPQVSATYTQAAVAIAQRVPDIPIYLQYAWDESKSHVRLSGILRNMVYYDNVTDSHEKQVGWGAQFSMYAGLSRKLAVFGEAIYGEGIGNYINDLEGNGFDMVRNPSRAGHLQTLPMYGFMGGAQYNFSPRMFCSATYSVVRIDGNDRAYVADGYRNANYFAGNVFYNLTAACQIGVEYLHGMRRNMNMVDGKANRIQAAVQYNF